MPTVSIIVPVYNVEPFIHRCIDSILAQTFTDFELILVDDGSPDNCGVICDEYAEKDSRIRVVHKTNGGVSSARNSGLDVAIGEYILFCDSDDYVASDWVEQFVDKVSVGTNCYIFGGINVVKISDSEKEVIPAKQLRQTVYSVMLWSFRVCMECTVLFECFGSS